MPLQKANLKPPFNIVRLSHLELGVTDPARSAEFYTEMLGLVETERSSNTVYLRGLEERNHHSFVLTKTSAPVVKRLGYKVASEEDLDQAQVFFERAGLEHAWVERHAQGRTLHARDPFGVPLELYFKMEGVERKLQAYGEYKGAQVMRIDHFNLFVPDVQAVHDFYTGELGFRVTEYTETDEDAPKLWAIWLHRKGNVHDLALTNGRGPRLHHIGVWVPTAMNIIHACDMLATTGRVQALERGPGRHGLSNAFFLYLRDPDGHRIELYTSDYLTVDPDFEPIRWSLDDPQRQTLWGHAAPKSWFEEGTPFEGVEVHDPVMVARPVVAR